MKMKGFKLKMSYVHRGLYILFINYKFIWAYGFCLWGCVKPFQLNTTHASQSIYQRQV